MFGKAKRIRKTQLDFVPDGFSDVEHFMKLLLLEKFMARLK